MPDFQRLNIALRQSCAKSVDKVSISIFVFKDNYKMTSEDKTCHILVNHIMLRKVLLIYKRKR